MEFHILDITKQIPSDIFSQLHETVDFENVTNGRIGNVLVNPDSKGVPIVRTTTSYHCPASVFQRVHTSIVKAIQRSATANILAEGILDFNNALIEVYDCTYTKMGFHSDQCLDIMDDSYIAVFSCYDSESAPTRTLVIKNKVTHETTNIPMTNGSVVLFSTVTNSRYLHKIILNTESKSASGRWLGLTFRLSKTWIKFNNNIAYKDGYPLSLATAEEKKEFYRLRSLENRTNGKFEYPDLKFSISPSDLLMPK